MSIVFAFQDQLILASSFIFIAGVFDFFDGFAARLLKAYSEIGKMLDSLADVVSFGVAPSAILFKLLILAMHRSQQNFILKPSDWEALVIPGFAFLVAIFSALRLAKFNIDTRQTISFIGMPTPANAFLIASLPFIMNENVIAQVILLKVYVLIPLIIVLSILLVSEIPMLSLKFKNLSYRDNKSRFILMGLSVILILIFKIIAIPLIFISYILISLIDNPQKKSKTV